MQIKKISDKIKNNQDAKVLVQNFAYLSLLQVASYLLPLLTMPYLARIIGVDGFGKIAFASAVMIWMQTITDWGFNFTATRDIAQNRESHEIISSIFSKVLYARLLLMLISFVSLVLLIVLIPKFGENKNVLLVSFLMIPGHIVFPDWFFQAMEKMKYITLANIISKVAFTFGVFLFIHQKEDYILQPLFVSLGFILAGIFSMYYIIIKWKVKLIKTSFVDILQTIKGSADVFINTLMPNLYNSFSVVILGFFGGAVSNGKLDAGMKLVYICQSFLTVVTRTFFPYLSRDSHAHTTYARINIISSFIMTILLFLIAPYAIIILFTSDFSESITVLRITSFSLIFLTLSEVYGTNYLIVKGYERELRKITEKGSIIGLIIAVPLIYYFSYIGAAVVITFTRGLLGIWTRQVAKKIISKNFK